MRRQIPVVVLWLLMLQRAPIAAQQSSASVHQTPAPAVAITRLKGSLTIDGRLDEAQWGTAAPVNSFLQFQPHEGAPATQGTEFRVLYDDDALYIGARMYDSLGRNGITAPIARRDQLLDGASAITTDKIIVLLDPYHSHVDRARFELNPAGVKGDAFNDDPSFDPVWEGAAHIDSLGWTAEMRIPFSQLRFSPDSVQTWGIQFLRYVDHLNEQDMWAFRRHSEARGAPYYGHLEGLRIKPHARQIELLPYAVSQVQAKRVDPADPFNNTTTARAHVGADAKILLTSSLTLDATGNPDFGQVEVDPATVNLSAFETFYPEKRPFFVAGLNAFNYGSFSCMFCDNFSALRLFYSRRIGRAPQLADAVGAGSAYADAPGSTQILGAAKVTGSSNGFTVGLLDAVTNRETERYRLDASPTAPTLTSEVEPLSNYFVARIKRDLRSGATTIGGIVTSSERRLDDTLLVSRLRRRAEVAGLDLAHAWAGRDYSLTSQFAVSDVAGSDSAIARTQRSSAHYFQRPDRQEASDGVFDTRYDPSRTELRGYGLYARLAKDNGNWLWETIQNWRSPAFEVNDLSYLDRADYKWMLANIGRQWTVPFGPFREAHVNLGAQRQYDYDANRTGAEEHGSVSSTWQNYWSTSAFFIHHPETLDATLTRGGPLVVREGYNMTSLSVASDTRGTTVLGVNADVVRGMQTPTKSVHLTPSIAIKPARNMFLSLGPSISYDEDAAQYVQTVTDPTATAFAGSRYVFAYLKQRTISLDTRVNVTFTPDLTLELFAQPFIASGAYDQYSEFGSPRSVTKRHYGRETGSITYNAASGTYTVDADGGGPSQPFTINKPDFTVRSLRGNAVMRWEYRAGSSLYAVWTQVRNGSETNGTFDLSTQSRALFADRPENIFLLKASYWVGG